MIKEIQLKNFKSHKDTHLEISNLTVLCGSNGVGKSSAIQALLLLRESFLSGSNFEYLDLKSNPINVGSAQDALYQYADTNEVSIKIRTDENQLNYVFRAKDSEMAKTMMFKPRDVVHIFDKDVLQCENLFDKNSQFVSAARLGPQPYYQKDDVVVDIYNQISVIEGRAEHFAHFLTLNKDKIVLEGMLNKSTDATDLFYQTSAWEKEISSGVNVIIEDLGNIGYELKYQFSTGSKEGKTDIFRSINVGFGLSYVLPVIVALLSAPVGALIFIENPEAHIHPNGQAKLAELICLASQSGVQIILETHSDHIINGILVQSKMFEEIGKGIAKENISIYHFSREETEHKSIATEIKINTGGLIKYPPQGFFDQFTIDRKFLLDF
jgi:predicted ATPase